MLYCSGVAILMSPGADYKMLPLSTPHIRLQQYKMRENHVSCLL